ncbi:OsmC family protein [bacterium AH-315-M05]|nr:OsmC family protein [bacterium AH-315-M05]
MSEHKVIVSWQGQSEDFSYDNYDRTHQWKFEGGIQVKASAAPEYLGKSEYVNPEEALAASLSSCQMLTFLAIASLNKYIVESYEDEAVAVLEKNNDGKMAITKVYLRPKVVFNSNIPDENKITAMHHKAHSQCFIANSVLTEVIIEPVF